MPYSKVFVHIVFAAKNRLPLLSESVEEKIYPYFKGICKKLKCVLLRGNGLADHVHLLVSLHPNVSISKLVKDLKGASSRLINEQNEGTFRWQDSYSVFSVSSSIVLDVVAYIDNQKKVHEKLSSEDELKRMEALHDIKVLP